MDFFVTFMAVWFLWSMMLQRRRRRRHARPRKWWVKPWLRRRAVFGQYNQLMEELRLEDPESFRNYMRMDAEVFFSILERVEPYIRKTDTGWREALSPGLKLAITIRYMATGNTYMSLQYSFRVANNTISLLVPEVSQAIVDCYADEYLKLPSEPDIWKNYAQEFGNIWNLPHCVGSIDGKHVAVRCPPNTGSMFYNYKGFYSIVLMAMCDAYYRFTYINIGACGAGSDGGVFSRTDLKTFLEEDTLGLPDPEPLVEGERDIPYFIVGDEAFPLKQWLMKPVPRRFLTHNERIYNYRLSRARRVIENAFGLLSNRFRCLLSPMYQKPENVTIIVTACCVVHNLLRTRNANLDQGLLDQEGPHGEFIPGEWRQRQMMGLHDKRRGNIGTNAAKRVREYLIQYVNSEHGAVPWQEERI